MSATGSSELVPYLAWNAAFEIGQVLSRPGFMLMHCPREGGFHSLQDVARLALGIGHHFHDIVPMGRDTEAIGRDD